MTCIVGLVESDRVYIGADSAGVESHRLALTVRADAKVFLRGPFIIGFTASFRMGQLLMHALHVPLREPTQDVFEFMVTTFVDAVRDCLKKGGFAEKEKEAERGGTFLVGYAGRLFTVEGDYQVAEQMVSYAACGCGDSIALGSLHSTWGLPPPVRITKALEAAEAFSAGVRGPFRTLVLEPETPVLTTEVVRKGAAEALQ
jgi:ATP-dependent protease HslVU (ClpYQ) peptidase subunit